MTRSLCRFALVLAIGMAFAPPAVADGSAGAAVQVAGGTLPVRLYAAWSAAYARTGGEAIVYLPEGSGAALADLAAHPVMGPQRIVSSDAFVPDAAGRGLVEVAVAVGGILPIVNVPGIDPGRIVVDGGTLGALFAGDITMWDDARLRRLNPTVPLPHLAVAVVHRADPSGTTDTLTAYLSKTSNGAWSAGRGPTVAWPTGAGVDGNDGVLARVAERPGAIGYASYDAARAAGIGYLDLLSGDGQIVQPSPGAFASAAAAGAWNDATQAGDLTATADPAAWPLTAATYALVASAALVPPGGSPATGFLRFALTAGEAVTRDSGFVPVPDPVRDRALTLLRSH